MISTLRLTEIQLKNFLGYDTAFISFPEKGLLGIVGTNGAGKSAIFDAITWCLYGSTIRSRSSNEGDVLADDVVRSGTRNCEVVCTFNNFKVTRSRKLRKTDLRLEIGGQDVSQSSISANQHVINSLLRADYRIFLLTALFGQGSLRKFVFMTDSEKKELFERILDLGTLSGLVDRAKSKWKAMQVEAASLSGKIGGVDGEIALLNRDIESLSARQRSEADVTAEKLADTKKAINAFEKEMEGISVADTSALSVQLSALDTALQSRERAYADSEAEARKTELDLSKRLHDLEQVIKRANSDIQALTAKRNSVLSLVSGSYCEVCGAVVTPENKGAILQNIGKEIASILSALPDAKAARDACLIDLESALSAAADSSSDMRSFRDKIGSARKVVQNSISLSTENLARVKILQARILDLNKQCASLTAAKTYDSLINEKKGTLAISNNRRVELASKSAEVLDSMRYYDFWLKYGGDKGLKSYMLDSIVPSLNRSAVKYSNDITGGKYEVTFSTQKVVGGVLKDNFDVTCSIKGGSGSISTMSGGERQRLNLIVTMCLQDLVVSSANSELPLKIFDEPFDGLDQEGQEYVFNTIHAEAQSRLVLFTTHLLEYQGCFDALYVAEKVNGVSAIRREF